VLARHHGARQAGEVLKPGQPFLGESRLQYVRDLTPDECDLVGFEGPLVLTRRELRFVFGPWRRTKNYVVTHRRHGDLLGVTRAELERLGVRVDPTD
jgi:hypothetical protein